MKKILTGFVFLLYLFLLTSCGGGGNSSSGSTGKSCAGNTANLSKYGSCFHINSISAAPLSGNQETFNPILFSFTYDDDFVGDLSTFRYEWTIQSSDIDITTVSLTQPVDYIGSGQLISTQPGTINLTLTVYDQDAVLDTQTKPVIISKRPNPTVKISYNASESAYETLKINISELDASQSSLKLTATIVSSDDTNVIGREKIINIPKGSNNLPDSLSIDLGSGNHTIRLTLEDDFAGKTIKEISLNAVEVASTKLIAGVGDLQDQTYNPQTGDFYLLSADKLSVYSANTPEQAKYTYPVTLTGDSLAALHLSEDNSKLLVMSRKTAYIFDTSGEFSTPQIINLKDLSIQCGDNSGLLDVIFPTSATVSNQGRIFMHANLDNVLSLSQIITIKGSQHQCLTRLIAVNPKLYYVSSNHTLRAAGSHEITEMVINSSFSAVTGKTTYQHPPITTSPENCAIIGNHNIFDGNILYDSEGCSYNLSSATPPDNTLGISRHYLSLDHIASVEKAGSQVVYAASIYDQATNSYKSRHILALNLPDQTPQTNLRMTKYYDTALQQAYDYELIYAFRTQSGKKAGVGILQLNGNTTYVLTTEK